MFPGTMLASPTTKSIRSVMMSKMRGLEIFTGIHATVSPGIYYTIDGKLLIFSVTIISSRVFE